MLFLAFVSSQLESNLPHSFRAFAWFWFAVVILFPFLAVLSKVSQLSALPQELLLHAALNLLTPPHYLELRVRSRSARTL